MLYSNIRQAFWPASSLRLIFVEVFGKKHIVIAFPTYHGVLIDAGILTGASG